MTNLLSLSLNRGLEDLTFDLDLDLYDNKESFLTFHNQVILARADWVNAKTRFGYWLHIICHNHLYRHEMDERGNVKYDSQDAYLAEVNRITGIGISTAKRNLGAVKVAIGRNHTVESFAVIGIDIFVTIYQAFETDRITGEIKSLKDGPIPGGIAPGEYADRAIASLSAGGEANLDPDLGSLKGDQKSLESRLLHPYRPNIWLQRYSDGGVKWHYERFNEKEELTKHSGGVFIEEINTDHQMFIIRLEGNIIPPEVKQFVQRKLAIGE